MMFVFSILVSLSVWAQTDELDQVVEQTPEVSKPAQTKSTNVLDFEADVIEGQRKAPQLFLQMQLETVNLDSVIYLRKNFNDFHALEKDRKPVYRIPRR